MLYKRVNVSISGITNEGLNQFVIVILLYKAFNWNQNFILYIQFKHIVFKKKCTRIKNIFVIQVVKSISSPLEFIKKKYYI